MGFFLRFCWVFPSYFAKKKGDNLVQGLYAFVKVFPVPSGAEEISWAGKVGVGWVTDQTRSTPNKGQPSPSVSNGVHLGLCCR